MNPKPLFIVIDGAAWGGAALERVVAARRENPAVTVVPCGDLRFLQTCDIWGEEDAWYEPDDGWGLRILGATAMDFATRDAIEEQRAVEEVLRPVTDAAVIPPTAGHPRVVLSGPHLAERLVWTGAADRVLYLCAPQMAERRRAAFGGIPNGSWITVEPTVATPLPRAA
jgi:hypothetical protein